jgi:uncharacterized protein
MAGLTRETTIRRDAQGRWFHDGQPLEHPGLTRAFDGWIELAEDGRFCLKNDINWAYVAIEGPPLFVRSVDLGGSTVMLRLSDGRVEPLDPATLREGPDGALYAQARAGTMAARFDTPAAMQLGDLAKEDDQGVYLHIAGAKVRPATTSDPLRFP